MNWKEYHRKRQDKFYAETAVKSIRRFSDDEKIALAEAGATCYHPREENGWDTREWLERICCVLNHGCCAGCEAKELCGKFSRANQS